MLDRCMYLLSLVSGLAFLVLLHSLIASPSLVEAQSSCATYYQCSALQQVSSVKVQGPITYWFDNAIQGDFLLTADDANNFKRPP